MPALYHLRAYLRRHAGLLLLGLLAICCANVIALAGPLILQRAVDSLGAAWGNSPPKGP